MSPFRTTSVLQVFIKAVLILHTHPIVNKQTAAHHQDQLLKHTCNQLCSSLSSSFFLSSSSRSLSFNPKVTFALFSFLLFTCWTALEIISPLFVPPPVNHLLHSHILFHLF